MQVPTGVELPPCVGQIPVNRVMGRTFKPTEGDDDAPVALASAAAAEALWPGLDPNRAASALTSIAHRLNCAKCWRHLQSADNRYVTISRQGLSNRCHTRLRLPRSHHLRCQERV